MTGRVDDSPRKDHYGDQRQPWDDAVDSGWGVSGAAFMVLRYLRRPAKLPAGWDEIIDEMKARCTALAGSTVSHMVDDLTRLALQETRRHSLESARWYYDRLYEMCDRPPKGKGRPSSVQANMDLAKLTRLLTKLEIKMLESR